MDPMEFPRYLVDVDGTMKFVTLREAGIMGMLLGVKLKDYVLNQDMSVRRLTNNDRQNLQAITRESRPSY